jgi:hypothetical protein
MKDFIWFIGVNTKSRKTARNSAVAAIIAGKIEFRMAKAVSGWMNYPSDQRRSLCSLSRRLGRDPTLVWLRDGVAAHCVDRRVGGERITANQFSLNGPL